MKVLAFIGDKMCFMEMENTLKAKQKFVDGFIEKVAVTEEIDLICNDEFLSRGMEPRVILDKGDGFPVTICGDCFICRHNNYGEFESIREEDMQIINKRVIHLDTGLAKIVGMMLITVDSI